VFLTSWDIVRTNQVIVWHIQLSACRDLKAADLIIIKFGFGGFQYYYQFVFCYSGTPRDT